MWQLGKYDDYRTRGHCAPDSEPPDRSPMLADSSDSQYTYVSSHEGRGMNNDIERMVASLDSDRDTVQKLILEYCHRRSDYSKGT
jgi:hypothetical protein